MEDAAYQRQAASGRLVVALYVRCRPRGLDEGEPATEHRDNPPLSGDLVCKKPFRFQIATEPGQKRDKAWTESRTKAGQEATSTLLPAMPE